jgi:large subunit ribosomal protein L9
MQVVLIKKVKTLGNPGEVMDVARGYAVNFLIPQGIATPATPGLIKEAKIRARKFDKASTVDDSAMVAFIKELEGIELTISAKANEKGGLFSSIHADNIVEELAKKISKSIDSEYIVLKEPIKKVGEHEIDVVAGDAKGKLKVKIEAGG